ncbi:MAG TPA: class I SAM-dependent methyltransferase [Usitatibacter sp.]|nr:class I SAM-dependent methyltransferase [Usitatibacter sp.]
MSSLQSTIYTDGTYLLNNPEWHADDSAWKARHITSLLHRHGIEPASVAEIGCGAGEVLRSLSLEFPDARLTGYDISPNALRICSRKANERLSFQLGSLLDAEERYELALAIDVFEHVEDCFAFLRQLRTKAHYKVFHIPLELSALQVLRAQPLIDARRSVGHIHHFNKDTALATLEDCGYTVIDCHYTSGRTELGGLGWKSRLLKAPREALFRMSPDLAARSLGGYSLLVLAR